MEEMILNPLAILLLFFSAYALVLVLAGIWGSYKYANAPKNAVKTGVAPRIKVLLPAYQPDEIFIKVLASLKEAIKNYPIDVLIVFQEADTEIIKQSERFGFESIAKSYGHLGGNSYQHALKDMCKYIDESVYDFTVIFDKDNILKADFFDQLYASTFSTYDIIQGVRRPLETTEGLQLFDAISERYNDLMLREGKVNLGGVLEISGSAAVIKTAIFKHAIQHLDAKAPGFDKNFMVNLLKTNKQLKTSFNADMVVYEEKTIKVANYKSQRIRWFGEQYYNAIYHFKTLIKASITNRSFAPVDYWLTIVRPPRSIQLIISFLLAVVDVLDFTFSWVSIPFLLNFLSFLIVAAPLLKGINVWKFLKGALHVLLGNVITSLSCLKTKYLGTFIHTR